MGGSGSGYSRRDIKELKDAFKKEVDEVTSETEGSGASGLYALVGDEEIFPIECEDGTVISADVNKGEMTFVKGDIEATISFEEYEDEYSGEYEYDYCDAAEDILADYGG